MSSIQNKASTTYRRASWTQGRLHWIFDDREVFSQRARDKVLEIAPLAEFH